MQYSFINSSLKKSYIRLLIITFLFFLLSLFFCHLDEVVLCEGTIRPVQESSDVISLYSGKVTNVLYKNAQFVNKGDLLFEQDCSYEKEGLQNYRNLKVLYEQHVDSLKRLQELLLETTEKKCPYDGIYVKENAEYASFINQYKKYQNEVKIKKNYYERQKVLYPSVISKQELENAENDYFQVELNFKYWLEEKKIQVLENYSDFSQKLKNTELEIMRLQKIVSDASVRARETGFINEKQKISAGESLNIGTQIATIVPDSLDLLAVINISNSSISKIKIGQNVIFQISDLPYTKYGKLEGKIILIPADAIESDNPYYPVEVKLDKGSLTYKKETIKLKVGTKVNAKIITDSNTIFQKIIGKLVSYDK